METVTEDLRKKLKGQGGWRGGTFLALILLVF